ncbi:hypothetical protein PENSPDRAFT_336422 [Peniophora sp. CONT]|nr:hypothetical protein PENSPDRAFT_336422 [Peniophora sp. CONT]
MDARSSDYVAALVKLQYFNLGLYAWEYLTHLDHDWRLVRGARPWRWPFTTWAYLICRNSILLSVIFSITTIGDLPCTSVIVYLSYIFPFFLVVSASCLLAARTIAIWSQVPWVIVICAAGLLALLAAAIFSMAILRVENVPKQLSGGYTYACVKLGPDHALGVKLSVTANHVVNWTLFSLMFLGLWRHRKARSVGLMRVIWTQSFVLLALAMTVDIPLLLLTWMEVNGVILSMGLAVAGLLLGLGTTRMTRSLYRSVQAMSSGVTHTQTRCAMTSHHVCTFFKPQDFRQRTGRSGIVDCPRLARA